MRKLNYDLEKASKNTTRNLRAAAERTSFLATKIAEHRTMVYGWLEKSSKLMTSNVGSMVLARKRNTIKNLRLDLQEAKKVLG